jgi:hypothetical protein
MGEMLRGIPMEYEPLRINRFFAEFQDDLGIEVWKVQKIGKPQLTINSVPISYMNGKNYVSGFSEWKPITIEFIDTIGPSTSQQLMEWARLHYESLTGRSGYKAGSAKTIIIKGLDPVGSEVQKWILEQCIITELQFGEFNHEDDGLAKLTLTVQPWRCILNN